MRNVGRTKNNLAVCVWETGSVAAETSSSFKEFCTLVSHHSSLNKSQVLHAGNQREDKKNQQKESERSSEEKTISRSFK